MKMKKRIIIGLMFVLVAVAAFMMNGTARAENELSADSVKTQIEGLEKYSTFFGQRYNELSQDDHDELKSIDEKLKEINGTIGDGEEISEEELERYSYTIKLMEYKYNCLVLNYRCNKSNLNWGESQVEDVRQEIINNEGSVKSGEDFGNKVTDLGYEIRRINIFITYNEIKEVQDKEKISLSEDNQSKMTDLEDDLNQGSLYEKIERVINQNHDKTETDELIGRFEKHEEKLNDIIVELCEKLKTKYTTIDSWNYGSEGLSVNKIEKTNESGDQEGMILSITASEYPGTGVKSISLLDVEVLKIDSSPTDPKEDNTEPGTEEEPKTEATTGKPAGKDTGKTEADTNTQEGEKNGTGNWFKEHLVLVIIVFSSFIILLILLIVLLSIRSKNKRKEIAEKRRRLIKERDDEKTRLLQQQSTSASSGNIRINQAPMQGGSNTMNDPNRGVLFADDSEEQTLLLDQIQSKGINVYLTLNGTNEVSLLLQGRAIIGRGNECDVQVTDPGFSRRHFMLEWDGESVYVSDLGTTNGTVMNGVRLRHKRRLEPGDVLKVGSTEIRIRW